MAEVDYRAKLIKEIQLRLGAGIIDLELDPDHYNYAVDAAMDRYRQRSGNSMEESFIFLDVQEEQTSYYLPPEVQIVRSLYRRGIGGIGGGSAIDPFSIAGINNIYMMQNPGGLGGGGAGTLATYDAAMQYQELAGRMFGRDVMFLWEPVSKKITFQRKFRVAEHVLLHVYNARPEQVLLQDPYSKIWLRDWATAVCKQIMGEARSLFAGGLGGPQGGVSLNGDSMKSEAKEEMDRLEEEIKNFVDSADSMPFLIG